MLILPHKILGNNRYEDKNINNFICIYAKMLCYIRKNI